MAKKPGRKILRVGLIQNQKILEERLFRKPQTVTVGRDYKKNTLVVPASDLPTSFPVFKWDSGAYLLQFTDKMDGRVSRGGRVETLKDLVSKGVAKKKGKLYQLKLTPSMRGRVTVGEATVLFQFVTPPPKQARPALPASMRGGLSAGIDSPLAVLVLISALIQVGFVVYLEMQDWPVPDDHHAQMQERFAELAADDPPEIEEEEDDGEEETEPQQDQGEEEFFEEEEEEPEDELTPEEMAEELQDERMDVEERVQEATVLDTLTADGDEEGALDEFAGRASEIDTADMFDGSEVRTDEGVDVDRIGGGGSPDADGEGLAEAEEMDEIGEGAEVDTGEGPREEEVDVVEPEMQAEAPDDTGDLDTDRLMQALNRLRNNVEACYQDHLRQNPEARGTVRIMITVSERGGRGEISSAEVATDEVDGGQSVGNCIARELETGRTGRLPPPEDGDARITIPYHFSPGG